VEYVGLDGEHLPLDDAVADHALSTWTLCTIPDAGRALAEIRRVLKPGGTLHFVEHGRSARPAVARWQDRLTPIQRRIAGGCHLNRPIDEMVASAGFDLTRLEHPTMSGPEVFTYLYQGVAVKV
jgi:ubiquinone/menaquinone biosynthesis C-methylase UbiE